MYDIIKTETASELIEIVNAKIREGWTPFGGLLVVQYYGQYIFVQTILKQDNSWYEKGA